MNAEVLDWNPERVPNVCAWARLINVVCDAAAVLAKDGERIFSRTLRNWVARGCNCVEPRFAFSAIPAVLWADWETDVGDETAAGALGTVIICSC